MNEEESMNRIFSNRHESSHIKSLDCAEVKGVTQTPQTPTSQTPTSQTPSIDMTYTNSILTEITEQLIKITNLIEKIKSPIKYSNYYDVSSTISTATITRPSDSDSSSYTTISIWQIIERNSPKLTIYNDGPGPLFVIISHFQNQYSVEFPLYEGEAKTYIDVREIKLRSPVAGCAYRLTEYELWKQKNIDFKSGRGYIRNQNIATGNVTPATAYTTSDEHTINTSLRRNATTGYIKNRDSVAVLFCWSSIDGTEYGQSGSGLATEYFTVDPNSAVNIDGWEIFSLRVGANINNVNYEVSLGWLKMPFPSQGTSASALQTRLSAQTIVSAVNLTSSTVQNSSVTDTNTIPNKSLTITLTSTGTISEYLVKLTALSSRENVAASFSEITSEIYITNGTYHWNIEDVGRYFRVDVQSIGTADASNYVTITVILEGTS